MMYTLWIVVAILAFYKVQCLRHFHVAHIPFAFAPDSRESPANPQGSPNKAASPHERGVQQESLEQVSQNELKYAEQEKSAEKGVELAASAALGEGQGMPHGLGKEKEEKVKDKAEFVSDAASEAAEMFAEASMQEGGVGANPSLQDFKLQALGNLVNGSLSKEVTDQDMEELRGLEDGPTDLVNACLRDYSGQCPNQFVAISTQCRATEEYEGPCAKIQADLFRLSSEQKMAWAQACQTDWPCMPDVCPAGTNYATCPVSWRQDEEGFCEAPDEFDKCDRSLNLGLLSDAGKKNLETKCGVRFPCLSQICDRDFSQICPDRWEHKGDFICLSPPDYLGPCPKQANLTDFVGDPHLKQHFEIVCLTQWPCIAGLCERDYSTTCPLGWTQLDGEQCRAPPGFPATEACGRIVSLEHSSPSAKRSFAFRCGVDFPCKSRANCARDFSSKCPITWIDVGGHRCRAPSDYEGPCDKTLDAAHLNDEEKFGFMKSCNVDWPCVGEWTASFPFMHESKLKKVTS